MAERIDPERRQRNTGRLLIRAYRAFDAQVVAGLAGYGHRDVRPAHSAVLSNLDLEGTRLTTIAERAGQSKQGIGQMVKELEALRLVRVATDPDDLRARRVLFTPEGLAVVEDAQRVIQSIEAEYERILGPRRLKMMRTALAALVAATEGSLDTHPKR